MPTRPFFKIQVPKIWFFRCPFFENARCLFFEKLRGYAAKRHPENAVSGRFCVEIKKPALTGKGTKNRKKNSKKKNPKPRSRCRN